MSRVLRVVLNLICCLPEVWESVDTDESQGGGGIIISGKLVDEVIPAPGGKKRVAVVEACGARRVHDLRMV